MSSEIEQFEENYENIKQKKEDKDAIDNLKKMIPAIDNIFDIHGKIGNGTFSTVFLGSIKSSESTNNEKKLYAIKHLIPTSHPNRILKELRCLIDIGGVDNVATINLCLRYNESVAFVMPYMPHERFQEYYDKMELKQIQLYMRNLLIAVRRVHAFNVIHRDIKPSNFLYNQKTGKFMLVDFGLAQSVEQNKDNCYAPMDHNSLKRKMDSDIVVDTKKVCPNSNIENDEFKTNPEFKMPLKQKNEIIPSQASLNFLKQEPALARSVKSTILSLTLTNRLQDRAHESLVKYDPVENSKKLSNKISSSSSKTRCSCYGKPQICNICLVRNEIPGASRAGTPGYRPPEVLLKYAKQTTAVDIWAVGVIFISILSGVYPFFKAPDDFVALAEIVMLFGDEAIRKTAFVLGRLITMSRKCKPLDLRKLCIRLKNRYKLDRTELLKKYESNGKKCEECFNCQQMCFDCLCLNSKYKTKSFGDDLFPPAAYDLLHKLLTINPYNRITAEEALKHPFLTEKYELF